MNQSNDAPHRPSGHVGKPIPGNIPVQAPANTTVAPYCFVGQIMMTFPNRQQYIGTATLIAARNPASTGLYALTCAHNLYDASDGGKATAVSFWRGLNAQAQPPYPIVQAVDWVYPSGYPINALARTVDRAHVGAALVTSSTALDYGLIKLAARAEVAACPVMTALGDAALMNLQVQLIGLYGFDPSADGGMYVGAGRIDVVTATQVGYPISTNPGSSGTAVMFDDSQVAAVHTNAGQPGDNHNYGRRLTAAVIAEIESWQT